MASLRRNPTPHSSHNTYPETFFTNLETTLDQLSRRALPRHPPPRSRVRPRPYLAHNGNYRSNELLRAAYEASATPDEGTALVLSLSTSANDPESLLADLDQLLGSPRRPRRQLLLRRLQLAQHPHAPTPKPVSNPLKTSATSDAACSNPT